MDGKKPRSSSTLQAAGGGTEQQQRAAKVLAALEKQVGERIDRDFFVEESAFRPLTKVIDVLGSSSEGANVRLERLRGQCELAAAAMEKFVDENYGYLNGNVEAMGKVLRRFHDTTDDVQRLRRQAKECKAALLEGLKEQNIRQTWVRKKEAEYVLGMLDQLDLLQGTPRAFDALIAERRYLAAVTRLDKAIGAMFSPELVEIASLGRIRDEVLARKEHFLEAVMEDVVGVLYLRIGAGPIGTEGSSGQLTAAAAAAAAAASLSSAASTRREQEGEGSSSSSSSSKGATTATATPRSVGSGGSGSNILSRLPVLHVEMTEAAERAAMEEGPGKDVGAFLCYMVEAARRLHCLDDLERFAQERIRGGIRRVGDEHREKAQAKALNDRRRLLLLLHAGGGGKDKGEGEKGQAQLLVAFLRALYHDFAAIVENHVAFARLLLQHTAGAGGDSGRSSGGVPPLVATLWREIQEYVQEILRAHITPSRSALLHGEEDAAAAMYFFGPSDMEVVGPSLPLHTGSGSGGSKAGGKAGAFLRKLNPRLFEGADIHLKGLRHQWDDLLRVGAGGGGGQNLQALVHDLPNHLGRNLGGGAGHTTQASKHHHSHSHHTSNYNPGFFPLTIDDVAAGAAATAAGGLPPSSSSSSSSQSLLLCAPGVAHVVPVYKPTLEFVTRVQALIGATGESALKGGVVKFLSTFVTETLLPYLSGQANTLLRKLLEDKDALTPTITTTSLHQSSSSAAAASLSPFASSSAAATFASSSTVEAVTASKPPNKAARAVLGLCASLHAYSTLLPQHGEEIAQVLQVALDCYVRRIKEEFDSTVEGTLAAAVLAGQTEEQAALREKHLASLRADPSFLAYQAFWHGSAHSSSSSSSSSSSLDYPNPTASISSPSSSSSGGGVAPYSDTQPGLWRMQDTTPYAITRNHLTLDKRRLLAVASLAYSADWLAHEAGRAFSRDGKHGGDRHTHRHQHKRGTAKEEHWVDSVVRDLRAFAEACLLFLRLEVDYTCFYHMQQLPFAKFDASSTSPYPSSSKRNPTGSPKQQQQGQQGGGARANMVVQQLVQEEPATVEICVASLSRFLLSLDAALCSVATPHYYAVAMAHAPLLLPRLLTHCVHYINKVSVLGLDKLSRVLGALQQTVPILVDGMGEQQAGGGGVVTQEQVQEQFCRARRFLALIELDEDALAAFIREHRTEFTKEEFRAVWMLDSPARSVTSESSARFNAAWLS